MHIKTLNTILRLTLMFHLLFKVAGFEINSLNDLITNNNSNYRFT